MYVLEYCSNYKANKYANIVILHVNKEIVFKQCLSPKKFVKWKWYTDKGWHLVSFSGTWIFLTLSASKVGWFVSDWRWLWLEQHEGAASSTFENSKTSVSKKIAKATPVTEERRGLFYTVIQHDRGGWRGRFGLAKVPVHTRASFWPPGPRAWTSKSQRQ